MHLDLTPCGHLKTDSKGEQVFCDKCRPKPPADPALEKQAMEAAKQVTEGIQAIMETWMESGVPGSIVSGCLLGAAAGIAQEIGLTRDQFLAHLKEFWP